MDGPRGRCDPPPPPESSGPDSCPFPRERRARRAAKRVLISAPVRFDTESGRVACQCRLRRVAPAPLRAMGEMERAPVNPS